MAHAPLYSIFPLRRLNPLANFQVRSRMLPSLPCSSAFSQEYTGGVNLLSKAYYASTGAC